MIIISRLDNQIAGFHLVVDMLPFPPVSVKHRQHQFMISSRHDSSGPSTQTLKQDLDSSFRILKTLCRKLKLPEDLDYQQLARLTPGYVGADLMALCREAAMNAVNRVLIHLGGCPGSSSQHPSTAGSQTHNNGAEGQTTDSDPGPGVQPGQDPPQVCISDGSIVLELHATEA